MTLMSMRSPLKDVFVSGEGMGCNPEIEAGAIEFVTGVKS